jgi:Protein of unknown function (DUF2281)
VVVVSLVRVLRKIDRKIPPSVKTQTAALPTARRFVSFYCGGCIFSKKAYIYTKIELSMTDKAILSEIQLLPETLKLEVLRFVVFLKSTQTPKIVDKPISQRIFGRSKGRYTLSPDFDAPLEDFNDYM